MSAHIFDVGLQSMLSVDALVTSRSSMQCV